MDLESFLQFDEDVAVEGLGDSSAADMHVQHLREQTEKLKVVNNMKQTTQKLEGEEAINKYISSQKPPSGRALRLALGFVPARIETSASY